MIAPLSQITGPRELKDAISSILSAAPTVIAFLAVPGLPIVPEPSPNKPSFPAATIAITPASTALSIAIL